MIAIVLAALAAASYGAADFSGAVASKRTGPMVVTIAMQAVSLVALNAVLVAFPEQDRHLADLAWAGVGGLAVAAGLTCLYKALAIGPMSAAAATTALIGALVPVGVGLGLGDRLSPGALVGVLCCIPACVMVSMGASEVRARCVDTPRDRLATRAGYTQMLRLSVAAGLGFGIFFVALSRVSEDGGLFPLVGARVASIAALVVVLSLSRGWERVSPSSLPSVILAGILDCAANGFYLIAVGRGDLSWVAAITSLYPVATVLLARVALQERLVGRQVAGLALSLVAVVLIATG